MKQDNDKIDLVYTWVDGNDPDWQEKKDKFNTDTIRPQAKSSCRFVSNDELKYSLRSVEKYAPWINHIYIITDNQVPKWLNTNNPKITIIDHTEIFPKDALPCFNSNAIEHCIINIPNLSEKFLYANDDTVFFDSVKPDFFFKNNKPIYRYIRRLKDTDQGMYHNELRLFKKLIFNKYNKKYYREPHHNIDPYTKTLIRLCYTKFATYIDSTIMNRFRTNNDIPRFIYHDYCCKNNMAIYRRVCRIGKDLPLIEILFRTITKKFKMDSLLVSLHNISEAYASISKFSPRLVCFNDTEITSDKNRQEFKKILEEYFPDKSDFENDCI